MTTPPTPTKRRIIPPAPQYAGGVYEDGRDMFEGMFHGVLSSGIPGEGAASTYLGANKWQTNIAVSMRDIHGALPNPNLFVYPDNRWKTFLWDYIGPYGLDELRNTMRMSLAGHGDAFWYSHTKEHHQGMKAHNEKGNCFIGLSIRAKPTPAVTMMSRTSQLAPAGIMDIAFGQLIAREWWKVINTSTMPTFNWLLSSINMTPFHLSIVFGKMGLYQVAFTEEEVTLRNSIDTKKHGGPWPGKHYIVEPENWGELPPMYQDVIKLSSEFISDDDYDRSIPERSKFAQYVRMQRKHRKWLWGTERVKPWIPVLGEGWFDDMYGMTKEEAKNYKKKPLKLFGEMTKEDFPSGKLLNCPDDQNHLEYYYGQTIQDISWRDLL